MCVCLKMNQSVCLVHTLGGLFGACPLSSSPWHQKEEEKKKMHFFHLGFFDFVFSQKGFWIFLVGGSWVVIFVFLFRCFYFGVLGSLDMWSVAWLQFLWFFFFFLFSILVRKRIKCISMCICFWCLSDSGYCECFWFLFWHKKMFFFFFFLCQWEYWSFIAQMTKPLRSNC